MIIYISYNIIWWIGKSCFCEVTMTHKTLDQINKRQAYDWQHYHTKEYKRRRASLRRSHYESYMTVNTVRVTTKIINWTMNWKQTMTPNTLCLENLNQINKRQAYDLQRYHTKEYKKRRASLRRSYYESYDRKHSESYYKKDQLDPKWL